MVRVARTLSNLLEWLIALLVAGFSLVVLAQVIFRYVFNAPLTWSEEVSRYLFIWSVMLAVGLGIKREAHVGMDLVLMLFKGRIRKWVVGLNYVLMGIFSTYLVVKGSELVMGMAATPSPILQLSLAWTYSAVPVGGAIMVAFCFEGIYRLITGPESAGEQ